jgi:hypothetical protein
VGALASACFNPYCTHVESRGETETNKCGAGALGGMARGSGADEGRVHRGGALSGLAREGERARLAPLLARPRYSQLGERERGREREGGREGGRERERERERASERERGLADISTARRADRVRKLRYLRVFLRRRVQHRLVQATAVPCPHTAATCAPSLAPQRAADAPRRAPCKVTSPAGLCALGAARATDARSHATRGAPRARHRLPRARAMEACPAPRGPSARRVRSGGAGPARPRVSAPPPLCAGSERTSR